MADKKSVMDVLMSLEKVFSGEQMYDEAMMELGLHVAEVRRQVPSLFSVLANVADTTIRVVAPVTPVTRIEASAIPAEPTREIQASKYTDWSVNTAKQAHPVGTQFRVIWDVQAPMQGAGSTMTLRGTDARYRYSVMAVEGDIMTLQMAAVLPLTQR